MAKRKLFFAVSIAISVFLVIYSEYVSLRAARHDELHGNLGVMLKTLSEFRPPQVLQFQSNQTIPLGRRSRRENLVRAAFRSSNNWKDEGRTITGLHPSNGSVLSTRRDYRLPPLSSMLNSRREIIGDVQILLQYAIIGFGKCGTTSMMHLLRSHSQLQSLDSEVWALIEKNPARLIERLHKKLTRNKMRGYKCPGDILATYALDYYRKYWPQTKLIVGVRHPVLHFQSLYNFRVQNFEDFASMLEPVELIGPCTKIMKMVCTKRSHFGYYLMQLGKHLLPALGANRTTHRKFTPLEKRIASFYPQHRLTRSRMKPLPNSVFLFDVHQLGDANATRREQFRRDLANYLGVSPDGYRDNMTADLNHFTPGREWKPSIQAQKDEYKINLCDPQHLEVRVELMKQARDSSQWIRETFLDAPGIYVSSREHLESLLETWMHDPCGGNETAIDNAAIDATGSASIVQDAKTAFEKEDFALPALDSILNETGHIVGDPQILLQFAIIGFGKAGTTTLMMWLSEHPELQSLQEEIWALPMQQPARLLSRLHRKLTRNLKRGYKCPGDVINTYSQNFYRTYLPKTKLFIGVRHPVRWLESLYNFRLQNFEDHSGMPHPNDVIGLCVKSRKLICTYRGNYAHHLMKLGKHQDATTRPFTPLEQEIANWYPKYSYEPQDIQPLPNEIFLFELSQLGDKDESRKRELRSDIQDFLGLTQDLPDAIHYTPGKKWDEKTQAEKDRLKIDICDDVYLPLRTELMQQARYSSMWIRQVFLDSPGVHVSSRPYFEQLLEQWMVDPCNNKTDTTELPSQTRARLRRANKERRKEEERKEQNDVKSPENGDVRMARPSLSSIIGEDGAIKGDAQSLLDFAIIGFERSGTTSTLHWLSSQPGIRCLEKDSCALVHREPATLISQLYSELPNANVKRCHKCTGDISEPHALDLYRQVWPETKLIIGVRHPVLHFQSLYNFRSRQTSDLQSMPHPNTLIGSCHDESHMVCTHKENFAYALMRLGKQHQNGTRPFTDLEQQIAHRYDTTAFTPDDVIYMPNDVFLYDVSQLADPDDNLRREFAEDMTDFLELDENLSEIPKKIIGTNGDDTVSDQSIAVSFNICNPEFLPVRKELMDLARLSSQWIRDVFLEQPGVYFASSRERLEEIFLTWMHDPCEPERHHLAVAEAQ